MPMKNLLFHRDFLLLALLLFMLKVGMDTRDSSINAAPTLQSPGTRMVQADPITVPAPAPTQEIAHKATPENNDNWEVSGHDNEKAPLKKYEPFLAHEVDQNILKQIECAQGQIKQALDVAQPTSLDSAQLRSLQQKLVHLRKQYQSTSPAVALLGPLGTAAIVLKEADLEKELLHTVKKVSSIIHNLAGNIHKPVDSIVKELESNHILLHELIHA